MISPQSGTYSILIILEWIKQKKLEMWANYMKYKIDMIYKTV